MTKPNDKLYAFAALNTSKCPETKLCITALRTRSDAAGSNEQAANSEGLDDLESFSIVPELLCCQGLTLQQAPSTELTSGRRQWITLGKQHSEQEIAFEKSLGEIDEQEAKKRRTNELEKKWESTSLEIALPTLQRGEALELFLRPPHMPDAAMVAYRIEHRTSGDEPLLIGSLHALFAPVKRTFD